MDGFHVKGHFYLGSAMVWWQKAQIQNLSFRCPLTLSGFPAYGATATSILRV